MITRVLPPDQWHLLTGTEAETLWPHLDPERAEIIVVEHEGEIVGSWVLMNVLHAECLWVSPEHRGKAAVCRRLLKAAFNAASGVGAKTVLTASLSPVVSDMVTRLGATKIPGEHFAIPVPDRDVKRGKVFHDRLFTLMPAAEHDDDESHHRAVGLALRMALDEHNPVHAEACYNLWADAHGYKRVTFIAQEADGSVIADIVEAVIRLAPDGAVSLMETRI